MAVATVLAPAIAKRSGGETQIKFVDQNAGPVLERVQVELIFWGRAWDSAETIPAIGDIKPAVENILTGPYMSPLAQYRGITPGTLHDALRNDPTKDGTPPDPPNPFSVDDIENLVTKMIAADSVAPPNTRDILYCVVLPPGVNNNQPGIVGEHSFFPSGASKVHYAWISNDGTLPTVTTRFSHELVEAVTDPEGTAIRGTPDTCSQAGWCEIADVCKDTAVVNGVTVQKYFSQKDGTCVAGI